MSEQGPSTRVVRAGLPQPEQGEPFLPGPVFAAPYHLSGDPYAAPASYTRYGNPTWGRYEEAVGGLEDAEATLFSSGMAAAAALLLTNLKPGSVLAMDAGCYHGVRALAETHLEPRGVEVRLAPPAGLEEAARGADLLWLESPSNPELEVYDLAALAGRRRHDRGGQHDGRPAAPATARPRRDVRAHQRHEADVGARRPDARLRDHPRRRASPGAPRLAAHRRRDPRALRGLARAPLPADARHPARARAATTRSRSRGCWPPATMSRASATRGCPATPATRSPGAR